MTAKLSAPQTMLVDHLLQIFACGDVSMDNWLRRRALSNQMSGANRTFVITNASNEVVAYYALAVGAVAHGEAPGRIRRNMPDPVPVVVLARLAVDQRYQGLQLRGAMLRDAVRRALAVSQIAGVRALLVHALNVPARQFYAHYGFEPSPVNPMTLMLQLNELPLGKGNNEGNK
jgi:GNAT superfamily N-acetyltransferase